MSTQLQAIHTRLQDDMGRAMANLMTTRLGLIVSAKLTDGGKDMEIAVDVINGSNPDDRGLDLITCRYALSAITQHLKGLLSYYLDDESVPEEDKTEWRRLYATMQSDGL